MKAGAVSEERSPLKDAIDYMGVVSGDSHFASGSCVLVERQPSCSCSGWVLRLLRLLWTFSRDEVEQRKKGAKKCDDKDAS